jgi:hypothetical protein
MSTHLHYEIVRARQREIAARATQVQHIREADATVVRCARSVQRRVTRLAAAVGVCIAATTAATMNVAGATPHPVKAGGPVSAKQLAQETRALERRGFVPTSCTVDGTRFVNYATGQSLTLGW